LGQFETDPLPGGRRITIAGRDTLAECEVILDKHSRAEYHREAARPIDERSPTWVNAFALLLWLLAGAVAFIPFARDTSPWNAVTLRVPGNQGNWWHVLVGAPFFLAVPMIWLRLRSLFSRQLSTALERGLIWTAVGLSIVGTVLVEAPFLLHLAGTSEWQRLAVLSLGFGIVVASGTILFLRRRTISPTQACIAGLGTAYLANAALCLVVYSEATGSLWSRLGWLMSMLTVWPMVLELTWVFAGSTKRRSSQIVSRAL
jgi:hypothetical protein